jgi:signal peptidase II
VIVLAAAVVVLLDQATKSWALDHLTTPRHILGPLNLTLTFNRGAAFGLGTGISPIVEAVVIVLIVAMVGFSGRLGGSAPLWAYAALGMVLGGALGNLSDRGLRNIPFHHAAVIDFIQAVRWWPVFNMADAAIVVGIAVLALYMLSREPQRRASPEAESRDQAERGEVAGPGDG